MATTLNTYIQQVQTLLHDPLGQIWQPPELTIYINEARSRVAQDSKCLRQVLANANFPSLQFVQGTEFITPQTFLPAPFNTQLIDTLGISVTVNQQRLKLIYKPYTWIDAFMRSWVNYQQWPQFWSRLSAVQYVIAPVPNITYPTDWDIAVSPNPLVDNTTLEQIPYPFQEPVQYYAAFKAKLKQQSFGEAMVFFNPEKNTGLYMQILKKCAAAFWGRIIDNPYSAPA